MALREVKITVKDIFLSESEIERNSAVKANIVKFIVKDVLESSYFRCGSEDSSDAKSVAQVEIR